MKKGFTLAELLIVVLIIGILGAVTLPQYQAAVERSRVSGVLPVIKSLREALDIEILSQGVLDSSFIGDEGRVFLDVDLNCSVDAEDGRCYVKNFGYRVWCTQNGCFVSVTRQKNAQMEDFYSLLSRKIFTDWNVYPTGVWENECMAHTNEGLLVCTFLAQQGWIMSDERFPH